MRYVPVQGQAAWGRSTTLLAASGLALRNCRCSLGRWFRVQEDGLSTPTDHWQLPGYLSCRRDKMPRCRHTLCHRVPAFRLLEIRGGRAPKWTRISCSPLTKWPTEAPSKKSQNGSFSSSIVMSTQSCDHENQDSTKVPLP